MISLIGAYRELPDTGKSELLDETAPSKFRHEMSEQPQPSAPVAYELMTPFSSGERSMVQNHSARKRFAIFKSTNVSRKSWPSIDTSIEIPCVETIIYSQKPKKVDLDWSLPPTPISESLQVSPIMKNFDNCFPIPVSGTLDQNECFDKSEKDFILCCCPT